MPDDYDDQDPPPDRNREPLAFAIWAKAELDASLPEFSRIRGQDQRDWFARARNLEISGRQLSAYLELLELPSSIQRAVAASSLSLNAARQFRRLTASEQSSALAAIAAGTAPATALKFVRSERCAKTDGCEERRARYSSLIRKVRAFLDDAADRVDDVAGFGGASDATIRTLQEFRRFAIRAERAEIRVAKQRSRALNERLKRLI